MGNYVGEQMFVSRISAKGKITNLTNGFRLKGGVPFSVYVRPKNLSTMERDILLSCKLYQEDTYSDVPVSLFSWVELVITSIAPNATLLNGYDIYWGSGDAAIAE